MIVGESQAEFAALIMRKKPERDEGAIMRKRAIQLAFDFGSNCGMHIRGGSDDLEFDRCGAAAVFVSFACTIEDEPGKPCGGKLVGDSRLDPHAVEPFANLNDMDCAVRMQIPPAQHRRLKQI